MAAEWLLVLSLVFVQPGNLPYAHGDVWETWTYGITRDFQECQNHGALMAGVLDEIGAGMLKTGVSCTRVQPHELEKIIEAQGWKRSLDKVWWRSPPPG
jgi:hypothetical protein